MCGQSATAWLLFGRFFWRPLEVAAAAAAGGAVHRAGVQMEVGGGCGVGGGGNETLFAGRTKTFFYIPNR